MKSKEQKRAEAIERAKSFYVSGRCLSRKSLQEYLDTFRTKDEIEQRKEP